MNQHELYELAQWMITKNPSVTNWIAMNPHGEWAQKPRDTFDVVANLRQVEPIMNNVIELLENNGIVVNLRYYPMCRIAEKYRKCISNDLHVTFEVNDPVLGFDTNWEWSYKIKPKTFEAHYAWGKQTSINMEEKGKPCCDCKLQWICGGLIS